jgi:hypothetical protein
MTALEWFKHSRGYGFCGGLEEEHAL